MSQPTMTEMLIPIRECMHCFFCVYNITKLTEHPDGSVTAKLPNPAVTSGILQRIIEMRKDGMSHEEVVKKLRKETVPPGYTIHMWAPGMLARLTPVKNDITHS